MLRLAKKIELIDWLVIIFAALFVVAVVTGQVAFVALAMSLLLVAALLEFISIFPG